MKATLYRSAGTGAASLLVISVGYLILGPMEPILRIPTAAWAKIFFWPGIQTGQAAWEHLHWPVLACWAVGVLTMTFIGGLLGLLVGGLRKLRG